MGASSTIGHMRFEVMAPAQWDESTVMAVDCFDGHVGKTVRVFDGHRPVDGVLVSTSPVVDGDGTFVGISLAIETDQLPPALSLSLRGITIHPSMT